MIETVDIFPWEDSFCTGIEIIDTQHRRLVELINLLAGRVAFRSEDIEVGEIFDGLLEYASYHFSTEEAIWAEYLAGEDLEQAHSDTHRGFVEKIAGLREVLDGGRIDGVAEEALGYLARWLASHILENDRYMAQVVQGIGQGLSLTIAKQRANEKMSGDGRILIDIILSIYGNLSANTLRLMREIAERKQREGELVQARIRAESANFARSRFLDNISHAFRTPLNAIMGMGQLLADPNCSAAERQDFTRVIMDSGQELLALVDHLIGLSEVDVVRMNLERRVFDAASLLHACHAQYLDLLEQKQLPCELRVAPGTGRYAGDSRKLLEMLGNLLDNAIKFTAHGRVELAVQEIRQDAGRALLEFSVSDTGIGIEASDQEWLFQAFSPHSLSSPRKNESCGIGLAIVRSLAELMGGAVGLESQPGVGSRFWFTVWLESVDAPRIQRSPSLHSASALMQ
ncbi:bacteriohemerythrin [Dechloromonas sp. ZY10]|uniref:bacteriohemerythrin n=1 Tax=Dechloromonas aquae TaxID=2664436 RepID=UPI003529C8BE